MATVIYPAPIFGPVKSRRLGISLGINLMPSDGKLCTFDCIYCECGFNKDFIPQRHRPQREEVRTALEQKLKEMTQEKALPDVLTFAGNGEPTAHPQFAQIIDDTLALRDCYCPQAKVSVLSNATFAHRPAVHKALERIDNNILKLDTVDAQYIQHIDRPVGKYDVEQIIRTIASFDGQAIVQSLFMTGTYEGRSVDNTTEAYVRPWLAALQRIAPREVMIYTIDRETPAKGLCKASPAQLDAIAEQVRALGIDCQVSY